MDNESKILVYLDGSHESYIASQYAIYHAKTFNIDLIGISIVNVDALDDLISKNIFLSSEKDEYQNDLKNDAVKYLHEFKMMCAEKDIVAKPILAEGKIVQTIKETILKENISILMVRDVSHLKSREDVFFDETDRLIRFSPCSVLVVKNPKRVESLYHSI